MFRKLQYLPELQVRSLSSESDPTLAFASIYIMFAKGRHRLSSRIYGPCFFVFVLSLDLLGIGDGVKMIGSDALLALRVLLYFGLFSVWGARPFSTMECILFALLLLVHGVIITIFSIGIFPNDGGWLGVLRVVEYIRRGIIITAMLLIFYTFVLNYRGRGTHISDIASAILKGRLRAGSRQYRRYIMMRELSKSQDIAHRGTVKGAYWKLSRWDRLEMSVVLFFFITNGMVWGKVDGGYVPALIIVETLELVSMVLFYVNKTQVEPMLFIQLLRISEIPSRRAGSAEPFATSSVLQEELVSRDAI